MEKRNPCRTTLKSMVETILCQFFVGIYRGIIIPGFLGRCEMDFVHPQYDLKTRGGSKAVRKLEQREDWDP